MAIKIPIGLAAQVTTRAARRCEYCHAPQILIGQAFHIDHIIPRSAEGRPLQKTYVWPALIATSLKVAGRGLPTHELVRSHCFSIPGSISGKSISVGAMAGKN
ncbi:MAG: HNH endonuclease [Nitrososphaera sp.]